MHRVQLLPHKLSVVHGVAETAFCVQKLSEMAGCEGAYHRQVVL